MTSIYIFSAKNNIEWTIALSNTFVANRRTSSYGIRRLNIGQNTLFSVYLDEKKPVLYFYWTTVQ